MGESNQLNLAKEWVAISVIIACPIVIVVILVFRSCLFSAKWLPRMGMEILIAKAEPSLAGDPA
jgi:hypothetical protein